MIPSWSYEQALQIFLLGDTLSVQQFCEGSCRDVASAYNEKAGNQENNFSIKFQLGLSFSFKVIK